MHVQVRQEVVARVERTVQLLHGRGFCVDAAMVGALCVGGRLGAEGVKAAAQASPNLDESGGRVHMVGQDPAASEGRQARHGEDSPAFWQIAESYTRRLARHCPWLQVACVAGSLASGGFEDGDDIDFNLVVEDDTKYLSYVTALVLAVPVSWRLRRGGGERTTPLLPKVVCLNVVWEESQARPFVRTDEAMAMELLLARPLHGDAALRDIYQANPALRAIFPQLADGPVRPSPDESPSAAHRFLRSVTRPRLVRRSLNAACYVAVRGLHAYVRFHRRRRPDVRRHVEEMERHKEPYGILQRPGVRR